MMIDNSVVMGDLLPTTDCVVALLLETETFAVMLVVVARGVVVGCIRVGLVIKVKMRPVVVVLVVLRVVVAGVVDVVVVLVVVGVVGVVGVVVELLLVVRRLV